MKFEVTNSGGFHVDLNLDDAVKEGLNEGIKLLAAETKNAISASILHPDESTGALVESVTANPCKRVNGGYYAGISFPGTDSHGIRNGLKAAEMEYGNSCQTAAPYADRAVHAAEMRITKAVEAAFENVLKVGG